MPHPGAAETKTTGAARALSSTRMGFARETLPDAALGRQQLRLEKLKREFPLDRRSVTDCLERGGHLAHARGG